MKTNIVKWFISEQFRAQEFVNLLKSIDVQAAVATSGEPGLIINRTQLNAIPAGQLPHWVFINRESINSELHTREASYEERYLVGWNPFGYILHVEGVPIEIGHRDYMVDKAREYYANTRCASCQVVDPITGEVVFMVGV